MDHASGSASVERKESYRGNDYDKDDRRNYEDKDRYERSRSASGGRRSPVRSKSPSLDNRGNVLYVGNLSRRLNEEDVKERFGKFGKIESIEMIKDPSTGECRGFAFVQFEDPKDAHDAMEALDQKEFDGRKMKVEKSKRGRGYKKTPGEYLGHYKSRYNGGGRRRSPSPYSRRRSSRGGGRRSRSPRDYRDRYSGRRYSRSRSPGERRSRGGYGYNDRRSRSNDRYRNDRNDRNDRYRYRDERSRSRE